MRTLLNLQRRYHAATSICVAALLACTAIPVHAQLPAGVSVQHASGQDVQPVFEGWQPNPDGTIAMWFGYLNRNYQEQVDIPVGPDNIFSESADQGQPSHFYPRRQRFVFKVNVPKDWDKTKRLVWTLKSRGQTETASAWLQPEWEVDDGVIQMNIGPGGAPPADPPNTAPQITGKPEASTDFGRPLTLTVSATDDGIPKPHTRGSKGLWIRWVLYRGPGPVTFDPEQSEPVAETSIGMTTSVNFSQPGNYWLQAVASDGLLETRHNVRVTVTAGH